MPRRRRTNKRRRYRRRNALGYWKRKTATRDLIYAPCISTPFVLTTNSSVGGIATSISLASALTTSNDWTNRIGSYKKFLCKGAVVEITPTSQANVGVTAFGFNPQTAGAPTSFGAVTDLKASIVVPCSDMRKHRLYLHDIQIDGDTGTLKDVADGMEGSVLVFLGQNAAQLNLQYYFLQIKFHTYFAYLS